MKSILNFTSLRFTLAVFSSLILLAGEVLLLPAKAITVEPQTRTYEIHKKMYPEQAIKVVAVRNLQSEHFLRDMEIEIQNVSNKPIYYIRISVLFPGLASSKDSQFGFEIFYGNRELGDLDKRPKPTDTRINPGEKLVLKVPEPSWKGFESYATEKKLSASQTGKLELRFDSVMFGDGTGFQIGQPVPVKQPLQNKVSLRSGFRTNSYAV